MTNFGSKTPSGASLPVKIGIGVALAVLAYWMLDRGRPNASLEKVVGTKLGELRLQPLTGDPPKFDASSLEGHVTLIDFWGPWCPPCKRELPHLVEIAQELSDRSDFQFVAVACGLGDDENLEEIRNDTESFLASAHLAQPTYGDQNGRARQMLARDCNMRGYPFTLLVDRAGVIRAVWNGYALGGEVEIRREIKSLLANSPEK